MLRFPEAKRAFGLSSVHMGIPTQSLSWFDIREYRTAWVEEYNPVR